jgi:hypothetical protein
MVADGDEGLATAIKNELGEDQFNPENKVSNTEITALFTSSFEHGYSQAGVLKEV